MCISGIWRNLLAKKFASCGFLDRLGQASFPPTARITIAIYYPNTASIVRPIACSGRRVATDESIAIVKHQYCIYQGDHGITSARLLADEAVCECEQHPFAYA